jgi:hypothetical protein
VNDNESLSRRKAKCSGFSGAPVNDNEKSFQKKNKMLRFLWRSCERQREVFPEEKQNAPVSLVLL